MKISSSKYKYSLFANGYKMIHIYVHLKIFSFHLIYVYEYISVKRQAYPLVTFSKPYEYMKI